MYFIANFQFISDQQSKDETDRRHGSFSMMVTADTMDQALNMFRQKLYDFRNKTALFQGKCSIYITQALEFDTYPEDEAIMLNFKSFAGDPILPFISCVVPTEQNNTCTIHEWYENHPLTEGQKDNKFIHFD